MDRSGTRPGPAAPRLASGRLWRLVHRWVGLSAAAVLLVSAATGLWLVLAGAQDTSRLAARCAASAEPVPLQRLLEAVRADAGALQALTLRLPDGEHRPCVTAYVRTAAWQGELFLDPASGRVVERRAPGADLHGFIFELHSNLLLGEAGKAALAVAGAVFIGLLASGVAMWWPLRARQGLRPRLRGGARLALSSGHRAAGVLLGLLVLASVASGTYVAWRPLAAWVNTLAGTPRPPPPILAAGASAWTAEAGATPGVPTLDALARAGAWPEAPEARLVDITLPMARPGPVRLRHRLPGDPHPNGQSYAWVDPRQAEVLARVAWHQADWGARLQGWLYPFHAGRLWGWGHTAGLVLAGAALLWLACSGPLSWWLRRRARASVSVSLANPPHPS